MDKPLIVLTDPVHPVAIERLSPHFRVTSSEDVRGREAAVLIEAEAVIIRSFKMTADVLEACPRLKVVAGSELPDGWVGKPWALTQGARIARGGEGLPRAVR